MIYRKNLIFIFILILIFLVGCTSKQNKKYDFYYNDYFMTETHLMIISNEKINENKIYKDVEEILRHLDNTFNVQKRSKEIKTVLMEINDNAGIKETVVSEEIIYVLEKAILMSEISLVDNKALFDVTVLPIWEKWGFLEPYSSYLDNRGTVPSISQDELLLVNYQNIIINKNNKTVMLKEKGMKIDLGAIVKGYATDCIRDYLLNCQITNAVIDVGRNIYVLGSCYENGVWPAVKLKRPFSDLFDTQAYYFGEVLLENQTIVTSGIYEKYIMDSDGVMYHHILDPRTGYPIDNNVVSVSVITDESINGDCYSTTLFALGLEKGMTLVNNTAGLEAIYVVKNGNEYDIYISDGLEGNFVFNDQCLDFGYSVKERI